jgi:glutathione reductase (NADPH)
VTVLEGRGALVDAHTVRFTDAAGLQTDYTTDKILLAVGGWPFKPPEVKGAEHAITSNEAFYLPERPERVLVVGGGYIAVEFASIFHGLGSAVTQMYRGPLFLRGFDDDVRKFLLHEMQKKHIDVRLEENPAKIEKLPTGALRVTTEKGAVSEFDCVMFATGRRPFLEGLGLERVGVQTGKRNEIIVNEWNETTCKGVFAVGDCTDHVNLTPVALREGHLLADALFGPRKRTVDYRLVPSAVFSQPEIATVGLTEQQAVEELRNVSVYTSTYKPMKHTISGLDEKAFLKLIVDDASDKVVGLHIVGDNAGEICQGFAVAMRAGAKKADFDDTIGIHPTAAEELCTMRTPSYKFVNGTKL